MVLETTFGTAAGSVTVVDALALGANERVTTWAGTPPAC
jgi:hypothetical protein